MALTYTLKISEKELQSKLSAMRSVEKNKFLVTVILSSPVVDLSSGNNEIGIFSHIKVLAPGGINVSGKAKIAGSLSYDPGQGAFFFSNPEISSLEIHKIPDKYIPGIKKIVLIVANKILAKHPVYKLKTHKLKHKFARLVLKSVTVKNEKLLLKLSAFKT